MTLQLALFPGIKDASCGIVKGYVPACYLDAVTPIPRETPDAWLVSLKDGSPAICPAHLIELVADKYEADGESRPHLWAVEDGEVVSFSQLTEYGDTILEFEPGGEWTIGRDMPAGRDIMVCADGDADTIAHSVEDLADLLADDHDPAHTYRYDISYYHWSGEIPFRFDATNKRFVAVE